MKQEVVRFLSLKEVQRLTGNLSRSTIWRWQQQGLFPRSRRLGPNRVGWLLSEIENWLQEKAR